MSFISNLTEPAFWLNNPALILIGIFQVWMLVDAIRRGEWVWAAFIFIGYGFAALFYYLQVYRYHAATSGFELPGAGTRQRIKELEAQIHHLDKALSAFIKVGKKYDILGKTKQEIIEKYGL